MNITNRVRTGTASIEALIAIGVGALVLLGLLNFVKENALPKTINLVDSLLTGNHQVNLEAEPENSQLQETTLGLDNLAELLNSGTVPENQTYIGNLSIEDAKSASDLAYGGTVGDRTASGRWQIVDVIERSNGLRAVVMKLTDPETLNQRTLVAFRGTDFGGKDFSKDVKTNFKQVVAIPGQYRDTNRIVAQLKDKYGDLVLTGHSLGGGQANYSGALNNVPGVGVDSAPLGYGLQNQIRNKNPDGPDTFVHYNNEEDPVSHPWVPGQQLGQIYTVEGSYGFPVHGYQDHKISNLNEHGNISYSGTNRLSKPINTNYPSDKQVLEDIRQNDIPTNGLPVDLQNQTGN